MSWRGYQERIVDSAVLSHGAIISAGNDLTSPEIISNDISYLQKKKEWELLQRVTYTLLAFDNSIFFYTFL